MWCWQAFGWVWVTLVAEDLTRGHRVLETISVTVCVVYGGFPSQCFVLNTGKNATLMSVLILGIGESGSSWPAQVLHPAYAWLKNSGEEKTVGTRGQGRAVGGTHAVVAVRSESWADGWWLLGWFANCWFCSVCAGNFLQSCCSPSLLKANELVKASDSAVPCRCCTSRKELFYCKGFVSIYPTSLLRMEGLSLKLQYKS